MGRKQSALDKLGEGTIQAMLGAFKTCYLKHGLIYLGADTIVSYPVDRVWEALEVAVERGILPATVRVEPWGEPGLDDDLVEPSAEEQRRIEARLRLIRAAKMQMELDGLRDFLKPQELDEVFSWEPPRARNRRVGGSRTAPGRGVTR